MVVCEGRQVNAEALPGEGLRQDNAVPVRIDPRVRGPLALQAVQAYLVGKELTRVGVNERIGGIRRIFKWGVAQELVPADVYQALMCVSGLRKGRTPAPETTPIGPVDEAVVDATLPALSAIVADMVQFQRLTGARPGEVCILRPCDIDRSDDSVWVYTPASHKTEHHGRGRAIYVGPKAQTLLAALRCLRLALPRECSGVSSLPPLPNTQRRAWSWSPGTSSRDFFRGDDRISYVPGEPLLCSCPALRPRQDQRVRPHRHANTVPALTTAKTPTMPLSRFNHTASALAAGTVRSMVGFAGRVTPTPRKTRFRPPARLYRTGLVTRWVPAKGLRLTSC